MKPSPPASTINKITIVTISSAEQKRRIEQAIAHRAYEIFEQRGGSGWHELEDWRQAESEVRCKFCFGLTRSHDAFLIGCDIARFEENSVEIWVAANQMTVCGKLLQNDQKRANSGNPYQGVVFRVVTLPDAIEPDRVVATLRHNFLEIRLPTVHSRQENTLPAHAA